jgi:acyl-coenzyme A synthetase/AMP-(fatty) acid ligase
MLFISPSYSRVAHVNLMKQLNCKTMLVPTIRPDVVNTILEVYEMRVYQIPELKDLLDQDYTHYPYEKTFDEARSEPLVALHTSGTTGLPKPVIWTHDWASSFAEERYLAPPSGFDLMDGLVQGARMFSLMPPFHVSRPR